MTHVQGAPTCEGILGKEAVAAMRRARGFLEQHSTEELLALVGRRFEEFALRRPPADKDCFPASYGGGGACDDDLLAGQGMFYITQGGKLMLDCVSGHYQMTWGYNHPALTALAAEAMELGVVWDNHANTPPLPVKMLARRLAALAGGERTGLERVLLGVATGSVACGAALKIMLMRYLNDPARRRAGTPVVLCLAGNYHGTDIVAQTLRGMWPGLVAGMEVVQLEPNDSAQLQQAFRQWGRRVAGFWAEPVMMNREAVLVEQGYLELARRLCTEVGALMALDEIQTGFWYPEVFLCRRMGVSPDLLIVGKGMTAGFHPLAALIYRRELDIMEQYDAISTNGNAALASLLGLCNLRLIEGSRERLARLARRHHEGLLELVSAFPDFLERVNGEGLLSGLKFRRREDALAFHRAALERGLWLRVHAYHPGHRTLLMKYPLVVEEAVVDYVLKVFGELLREGSSR